MAHPTHDGRQQNKVYVNPNFNHEQKKVPVVHFNPAFSVKSKIFVNPNFVNHSNAIANYDTASTAIYIPNETFTTPIAEPCCSNISSVTQPIASKSRFSLTRHKNVCTQVASAKPLSNQNVNTATLIKSKYSIQRCTNNIAPIEVPANLAQQREKVKTESLMPFTKSRFKLTRSQENFVKPEFKTRRNIDLVNDQKMMKHSRLKYSYTLSNRSYVTIQARHKNRTYILKCNKKVENLKRRSLTNRQLTVYQNTSTSKLKKNNIPCPLFTKFGQCLRKDRGSCCFLHDKKHVRLCKKFLKGLCFNDNCLLSHVLSSQKMPTCHFYLKGLCVKENCPYLHVKLNEDAKICKDFLKGYCEKGENCLDRHDNVKPSTYSAKRWTPKPGRKKIVKMEQLKANVAAANDIKESSEKPSDNERYYRDKVQEATSSDIHQIKPSRCKLGSLPSFIKL